MQRGVEILLEASVRLDCTVAVRVRALVLYHHFMRFSSQKSVSGHNEAMVAAAALKCASRYEEESLEYDILVAIFYCIVNDTDKMLDPTKPEFEAVKKSLITVDHIMQRKLEYVFSHRLAHEFLVPFLCFILERNFRLGPLHRAISENALRFANDMYTDPMSLNYKPDHLAIACIHASMHILGLLKCLGFIEPWFQAFSRDLTASRLREIKVFLFSLYDSEEEVPERMDLESDVLDKKNGTEVVNHPTERVQRLNPSTEESQVVIPSTEGSEVVNPSTAEDRVVNPSTEEIQELIPPTEVVRVENPSQEVVQVVNPPLLGVQVENPPTEKVANSSTVVVENPPTSAVQLNSMEKEEEVQAIPMDIVQVKQEKEVLVNPIVENPANPIGEVQVNPVVENPANPIEKVLVNPIVENPANPIEKVQVKLEKEVNPPEAVQVKLEKEVELEDEIIVLEVIKGKKPNTGRGQKKKPNARKHEEESEGKNKRRREGDRKQNENPEEGDKNTDEGGK